MTDALSKDDEDVVLAGELALRLLTSEEEQAARERIAKDPAFAELVLAEEVKEIAPDSALRQAILERAFEENRWKGFRAWRWTFLAVAILLIGLLAWPKQNRLSPDYMAELVAVDGSFVIFANYFAKTQAVIVRIDEAALQSGRVLQVWGAIPDQSAVLIGVISTSGSHNFALPEALWNKVNETRFKIIGATTGEVLASAALEPI